MLIRIAVKYRVVIIHFFFPILSSDDFVFTRDISSAILKRKIKKKKRKPRARVLTRITNVHGGGICIILQTCVGIIIIIIERSAFSSDMCFFGRGQRQKRHQWRRPTKLYIRARARAPALGFRFMVHHHYNQRPFSSGRPKVFSFFFSVFYYYSFFPFPSYLHTRVYRFRFVPQAECTHTHTHTRRSLVIRSFSVYTRALLTHAHTTVCTQ